MTEIRMSSEEARRRVEERDWKPRNVVWELTLACNLRCGHCGSRAGQARESELAPKECLDVGRQLADLGAELVTLSGGEPTLRPDWDSLAADMTKRGILVNMVTNGFFANSGKSAEIARRALDAGMCNAGVSIDGPPEIHEKIRGNSTFSRTMTTIEEFSKAGLRVGVLTTVNRLNYHYLEMVRKIAMDAGATMWRLQLGKPMGTLKDNDEWVLSPEMYYRLIPRLAKLKQAGGIHVAVGDSIGYYGPHDQVLRGRGWRGREECWQGCQAGMQAVGIESDGGIKGCLSLQARWDGKDPFVEGNVRQVPLADLWYSPGVFAYNRDFRTDSLTGGCATCRYGALCRGGARCVSSSFHGHLGEDRYCYHLMSHAAREQAGGSRAASAAAAAAALVISAGVGGCVFEEEKPKKDVVVTDTVNGGDGTVEPDNCCAPEYGVFPDAKGPDVQAEYGIPPDITEPDNCCAPEYGIPVDVKDTAEPDVTLDYGIPPDVQPGDAIDCSKVCCECEYGVIPEEVLKECCQPPADVKDTAEPDVTLDYGIPPDVQPADVQPGDAIDCSKVCCMCEYGIIPEEVYKECCDPCKDACCDCDYGEPPPPQCCPK
jgi:MoaA/NifB/PqqE/SkfB family radical SAM enzyme